jgi:hypothetical protein
VTHRAQQVIDAIAAELAANVNLGASVFTNRVQSLSDPDQELPAVSVVYGSDSPLDASGASNFAFLDSLLAVQTVAFVRELDEQAALARLLELRRQIHITLMASDRSQGLGFVIDTRYAGADAPALDAAGSFVAARLVVSWAVHYRMNISDPA